MLFGVVARRVELGIAQGGREVEHGQQKQQLIHPVETQEALGKWSDEG
jgi:hypothetical protein